MYEEFDKVIEAEYQENMKAMVKPEPEEENSENWISGEFDFHLDPAHLFTPLKGTYITVKWCKNHIGIFPYQYSMFPGMTQLVRWSKELDQQIHFACINNFNNR